MIIFKIEEVEMIKIIIIILISINLFGYDNVGNEKKIIYPDKSNGLSFFSNMGFEGNYKTKETNVDFDNSLSIGIEYPFQLTDNWYFTFSEEFGTIDVINNNINETISLYENTLSVGFIYKHRHTNHFSIDYSILQSISYMESYNINNDDIGGFGGYIYPRVKFNYNSVGFSVGYKTSNKFSYGVVGIHYYY
jgi:hypothetical protein